MANMRIDRNPMPVQDPAVRSGNFSEVALGYTEEQAIDAFFPRIRSQRANFHICRQLQQFRHIHRQL